MITFIDDASRMIMGYRFLPNKTSYETALALEETLRQSGCIPYAIWTDNGGEFAGVFDEIVTIFQIRHIRTEPYNPQQNGKIERFWRTANRIRADRMSAGIERYNEKTPHFALPEVRRKSGRMSYMTPRERYDSLEKRGRGCPGTWVVDGEVFAFT
jgi:transposase InsO family protein